MIDIGLILWVNSAKDFGYRGSIVFQQTLRT